MFALSPDTIHRFAGAGLPLVFVVGVCAQQFFPLLPFSFWWWGVAALLAAAAALMGGDRRLLLALFVVAGFFYAAVRADVRLDNTLAEELVWRDITVEGVVDGAPVATATGVRFDFLIDRLVAPPTSAAAAKTLTVRLRARINDYRQQQWRAVVDGARLRFVARLRPPTGGFNPHGFDYAGYLFSRNIRLVGYLRGRGETTVIATADDDVRRRLRARIFASTAPQPALQAALVLGDRSGIDEEGWRVLRRTGTAHLVSVSGTHIGLIYMMVVFLLALLWRSSRRLPQLMPVSKAALLLGLPATAAYAWLAGFGVPVQRSFMMVLVAALVLLFGGAVSATTILAVVMLLVVLIDPWAVVAPGFWLSFALTGMLLFAFLATGADRPPLWRRLLSAQFLASFFAVPLTLWFFNEASLISPLANLIAVPVVGVVALPLALVGIFVGDWCWHLAGGVLALLWQVLEWMASFSFAAWSPAQPPLWLFVLGLAGCAWMLMPRGVPLRFTGLLPVAAMLLWQPSPLPFGQAQVAVLDVGQGNAVVVQTAAYTLVYDVGRAHGGRVVADYLRGNGVRRLDRVMVSHNDDDHIGGLDYLRTSLPIDSVVLNSGNHRCERGQQWERDGVVFSVLHPPAGDGGDGGNDGSCVLSVRAANGGGVLLLGDVSREVEEALAEELAPTTALLVAHHGSRHSTSEALLRVARPSVALISVGRNNYGHPHRQTLARLRAAGAVVYRTDHDGALLLRLDAEAVVETWRRRHEKYWH